MTDSELTPYNLLFGEVYLVETDDNTNWYITNYSSGGSRASSGFCINVNKGYNSDFCYVSNNCQFYRYTDDPHAYTNCKNPKFRRLTENELSWFNHCKMINKFVPYNKINSAHAVLREFPTKGVCWTLDPDLIQYLLKFTNTHSTGITKKVDRGIAWNSIYCWGVMASSGNPEYSLAQLQPFFRPLMENPLTPEECFSDAPFPDKWCIRPDKDNQYLLKEFLIDRQKEWKDYKTTWVVGQSGYFHYPPPFNGSGHSQLEIEDGYSEITTEMFKINYVSNKPLNSSPIPEKWYIEVNSKNCYLVNQFLIDHKDEYKGYDKSWKPCPGVKFFYPQHARNAYGGEDSRPLGYQKILTNDFITHVLTKKTINNLNNEKNEQQERFASSLKIHRLDITVRDTDPIRATTIGCAKSKIKIGG